MSPLDTPSTPPADVTLACQDLDEACRFYTEELGFRIDLVFPAERPRRIMLGGHGLRVSLNRVDSGAPVVASALCPGCRPAPAPRSSADGRTRCGKSLDCRRTPLPVPQFCS